MNERNYTNVTFEEIEIGAPVTVERPVTQPEVEAMALVSGDVDPYYLQPGAREAEKGVASAQAVGAEAILSGLINRRMPGPGTRILEQNLRFRGTIRTGDPVTASVTAKSKNRSGNLVVFDCLVKQGASELIAGTVTVEAPTGRLTYENVATPEIILRRNDAIGRLLKRCEGLEAVTCAIAHPCDRASLLGPLEAARRGLIVPVLVGPEAKIRAVANAEKVDLPYRIVSTEHSQASAEKAVAMARAGEVEALMKGSLHTDELMGAVVSSATGLRTARRISHAFIMDVPAYPRPLMVTDAAVNISPDLATKADIVQNAIDLAQALGVETPKVAILAAVEIVNPKMPATLDAAALCKMADRGQITGGILDGPLAFDNAISEEAAKTKKIVTPVAGKADILLVPDLEAGNMVAKQLQYLAGADSAGIVLGARVPIVLTSRADNVRSRLASVAVMALVAHAKRARQPKWPTR
jgi:phosphotransacetylase/acyl dehydratase